MMVNTEEPVMLVLRRDTEVPVQEKVGRALHSQSGTEQVRLLGWPASRVSGRRIRGVKAGEERGEVELQDGVRCSFRGSPGSDPALSLSLDAQTHLPPGQSPITALPQGTRDPYPPIHSIFADRV